MTALAPLSDIVAAPADAASLPTEPPTDHRGGPVPPPREPADTDLSGVSQ